MIKFIIAVRKNPNGNINSCKCLSGEILSKIEVINDIESGNIYYTALKRNEEYIIGSKIDVINTIYGKYLRTDGNSIAQDNLGNLPLF